MTSVTSPQQTGRGGAEIPGPRGRQGVRLLVLGTDADARELRERAAAAGFELAQRYSARVSHVAYGSGIDPDDGRYSRIREAGLAIVPIQTCARALGLAEGDSDRDGATHDARDTVPAASAAAAPAEPIVAGATDAVDEQPGEDPLEFPPLRVGFEGELAIGNVADAYAPLQTLEVLENPSAPASPPASQSAAAEELPPGAAVIGADPWTGEGGARPDTDGSPDGTNGDEHGNGDRNRADDGAANLVRTHETAPAPRNSTAHNSAAQREAEYRDLDVASTPTPHADRDLEVADAPEPEAAASADPAPGTADAPAGPPADAASAPARHSAGYVLLSLAWALVPFVSFGLLTPAVFGYAALRLRSRMLALIAFGYTVAVVLSFALSAAKPPQGTAPSHGTGALLTLALAATWIGGTVHALSLRTKVFGR